MQINTHFCLTDASRISSSSRAGCVSIFSCSFFMRTREACFARAKGTTVGAWAL